MIDLTEQQLNEVEQLAALNATVTVIAKRLKVSVDRLFTAYHIEDSPFRQAYEQGKLKIKLEKERQLIQQIKEGSVTAIQIHDKREEETRLATAKQRIFGRT
jgi:hypothetical protein